MDDILRGWESGADQGAAEHGTPQASVAPAPSPAVPATQAAPGVRPAPSAHERVRVLVETDERTFRGYVYKPVKDERFRLSDHLNSYDKDFICLSEVQVTDRGQSYRVGDKRDFVAVAVAAITYITPIRDDE